MPEEIFKYDFFHVKRRKIRLIEGNAKCRHLNKFTCKGTVRQVFIRVYRLVIQSVMLVLQEHHKQNPRRGGGLRQIKPAAKSRYRSIFFR
jgi:hypothetical protein